jgi:hypothetical protein
MHVGSWDKVERSKTTTFVHEDTSEVVGGLENEVNGVIEFGGVVSVSDSGTTSVNEHANEADGSRGGEIGVFEMHSSSDLGTLFVHEDVTDGAESEGGVIEGMNSGSGSGSGWTFVTEGACMC